VQLTQVVDSNTLLTYSLSTVPTPVSVNSTAGLTFVLSCPASVGSVTVSQINFILPVGASATDLMESFGKIKYSVSSTGSDNKAWQIGLGPAGTNSVVLKPAPGGSGVIQSQGLTVALYDVHVSPIVGTAPVMINEHARSGNLGLEWRKANIDVAKFPENVPDPVFAASAPMIQNGDSVTLSWFGGSIARYQMFWGTAQPVDVSRVSHWTSPALGDTTSFILQVSYQSAGQTVTQRYGVTVVVGDPDFTATTLEVLATSHLNGNVRIGAADGGPLPKLCPRLDVNLAVENAWTQPSTTGFRLIAPDPHFHLDVWALTGNENPIGVNYAFSTYADDRGTDAADALVLTSPRPKIDSRVGLGQRYPQAKLDVALDQNDSTYDVLRAGKGPTNYLTIQNNGFIHTGSVSLGVGKPDSPDQLVVTGNLQVLSGAGSNPMRLTSAWSEFPASGTNHAEICNDTGNFKSLMIVGNRSKDPGTRNVSIYDQLFVNGNVTAFGQTINGTSQVNGTSNVNGTLKVYAGRVEAGWLGPPNFWANADGVLQLVLLYIVKNWYWGQAPKTTGDPVWRKVMLGPTGAGANGLNCDRRDVNFSDARLKTDVRPISGAIEKVHQLQGVTYCWNDVGVDHFTKDIPDRVSAGYDATPEENQKVWDAERVREQEALAGEKVGLIAHEAESDLAQMVHVDEAGYKHIQYQEVTALLVEAIKEQNALIKKLSERVAALEAR
jgi:Chaperone of endosialidase